MSKKIIFVLLSFVFLFLGTRLAYAGVVVNEIKYSPTTKQWIEIYNDSSDSIDLTQYKILDDGAKVNGHGISLCSGSLTPRSYAVIAKVPEDFSNPSFTLCKSSLGIKSTSDDTVILKLGSDVVDTVAVVEGSATDGTSLQLADNTWIASMPTPGEANETSNTSLAYDNPNNNTGDSQSASTTSTSTTQKSKVTAVPTMKAKILANTSAFTEQPLEMKASILGYSNENIVLGRVYWNFGDGSSLEQMSNFDKFYHTYYYPGEYAVFLEYYKDSFSKTPEATSKIIIKVIPTTVVISRVGDAKDFFVELSNNASSDIDISNWVISTNGKIFVLPKNSVILSKKSMIISGKITGFIYGDQYNLKLLSSTGETISSYLVSNKTPNKNIVQSKISTNQTQLNSEAIKPLEEVGLQDLQVPVENLGASVVSSDPVKDTSLQIYFLTMILTIFIGASAGAVYFIRQKKNVAKAGEDFKILDE